MDLLAQLRNITRQPQGPTYKSLHELCGEAADEIERLRAANTSMMFWMAQVLKGGLTAAAVQDAKQILGAIEQEKHQEKNDE